MICVRSHVHCFGKHFWFTCRWPDVNVSNRDELAMLEDGAALGWCYVCLPAPLILRLRPLGAGFYFGIRWSFAILLRAQCRLSRRP